jgi:hypothetical protein
MTNKALSGYSVSFTVRVETKLRLGGVLEPVWKMGSTGDSPVPVGDPPTGRARRLLPSGASLLTPGAVRVPPGESPTGTGQWPVLPKHEFPDTLLGRMITNPGNNGLRISVRWKDRIDAVCYASEADDEREALEQARALHLEPRQPETR